MLDDDEAVFGLLEGGDEEAADNTEDEDVAPHDGVVKKYTPPAPDSAHTSRLYKQILHEQCLLRCKLQSSLQEICPGGKICSFRGMAWIDRTARGPQNRCSPVICEVASRDRRFRPEFLVTLTKRWSWSLICWCWLLC